MAARGPYAKGVAKRAEILDTALDVIAQNGYSGATVKELADAVGLSQNGLLHYFGSKDALFAEILRHHGENLAVQVGLGHVDFADGLYERVVEASSVSVAQPGMSQLQLSVAIAASEDDHHAHALIRDRYDAGRHVATAALATLRDRGQFPPEGDPDKAGVIISAVLEGIQMLWLYDHTIDVPAHMAYLLDALGITRDASPDERSVGPTSRVATDEAGIARD